MSISVAQLEMLERLVSEELARLSCQRDQLKVLQTAIYDEKDRVREAVKELGSTQ